MGHASWNGPLSLTKWGGGEHSVIYLWSFWQIFLNSKLCKQTYFCGILGMGSMVHIWLNHVADSIHIQDDPFNTTTFDVVGSCWSELKRSPQMSNSGNVLCRRTSCKNRRCYGDDLVVLGDATFASTLARLFGITYDGTLWHKWMFNDKWLGDSETAIHLWWTVSVLVEYYILSDR